MEKGIKETMLLERVINEQNAWMSQKSLELAVYKLVNLGPFSNGLDYSVSFYNNL